MKKEKIIELIKLNLTDIIPELETEEISATETLVDLGANSIDRGELIAMTLEVLGLEIPRIEFVTVESIDDLAELICKLGFAQK